eukprot:COSAG03_NODE_6770_length_1008_cov_1.182618_1_plen_165_part_00
MWSGPSLPPLDGNAAAPQRGSGHADLSPVFREVLAVDVLGGATWTQVSDTKLNRQISAVHSWSMWPAGNAAIGYLHTSEPVGKSAVLGGPRIVRSHIVMFPSKEPQVSVLLCAHSGTTVPSGPMPSKAAQPVSPPNSQRLDNCPTQVVAKIAAVGVAECGTTKS